MIKHFFSILCREFLLRFLLVSATTISLVIQFASQSPFQWIRLIPIFLTSTYLFVHLRSVILIAKKTYYAVPVPYSVCIGQTRDWFESALRQQEQKLHNLGLAWNEIQRLYRIHQIDWTFFNEQRLNLSARQWLDKIKDIAHHFDCLLNRIPSQIIFHIFFAAPGSLTLALGAKVGRRMPLIVYQHAGMVRNPYKEVFNTEKISQPNGYHMLNKRITQYRLLNIEKPELKTPSSDKSRILVILDFTGHELRKPYPICGPSVSYKLTLKDSPGHIPLDSDWISIAHEITSFIFSQLDQDYEVHLLPGIPASLAFILGTILGLTPGVWVYHYNMHDSSYTEPFPLHQL